MGACAVPIIFLWIVCALLLEIRRGSAQLQPFQCLSDGWMVTAVWNYWLRTGWTIILSADKWWKKWLLTACLPCSVQEVTVSATIGKLWRMYVYPWPGKFLEHADVHGNLYGTSFAAIQDQWWDIVMCAKGTTFWQPSMVSQKFFRTFVQLARIACLTSTWRVWRVSRPTLPRRRGFDWGPCTPGPQW